jgi:excinuclease ABC subunit B
VILREYAASVVSISEGQEISRDVLLRDLVNIQYDRNDIDFQRGRFRVRGDVVEIFPASVILNMHCGLNSSGMKLTGFVEVDSLDW